MNAYLKDRPLSKISLEYTVLSAGGLDYTPEEWSPVDSLAWLKAMAWDLRGNMEDEIGRVLAGVNHTPEQVAELYPAYPYSEHQPIVRQGAVVDGRYESQATRPGTRNPARPPYTAGQVDALEGLQRGLEAMPEMLGHGSGLGSNSWVVDGEHSATGKPLLANDPHLGTSLPGIWYQVGLHCRTVSAECPVRRRRLQLLGRPGRGDRPQPADRVGLHQPRPGRQRPLPREDRRRPLAVRRQVPPTERADRDDQGRTAARTSTCRSARRGTGRCSPTCRGS